MARLLLYFGSVWRLVNSVTIRPFSPSKQLRYSLYGSLEALLEKRKCWPCLQSNYDVTCPAHSLATVQTGLGHDLPAPGKR